MSSWYLSLDKIVLKVSDLKNPNKNLKDIAETSSYKLLVPRLFHK